METALLQWTTEPRSTMTAAAKAKPSASGTEQCVRAAQQRSPPPSWAPAHTSACLHQVQRAARIQPALGRTHLSCWAALERRAPKLERAHGKQPNCCLPRECWGSACAGGSALIGCDSLASREASGWSK